MRVPKDASEFSLQDDDDFEHTGLMFFLEKGASGIALPYNTYSILGLVTDSTIGFDASLLNLPKVYSQITGDRVGWQQQKNKSLVFFDVNDAFRELLEINNLCFTNPFGNDPLKQEFYEFTLEQWKEAEANLLGDNNLLILKKL